MHGLLLYALPFFRFSRHHCPYLHFNGSELFGATFSPCNPSVYNDMTARSPILCRHHSSSMLRIVQVLLVRLPARQTAPRDPPLDVHGVWHALPCHHDHRLFRHTPERLRISSGAFSGVMLNAIGMYNAGFHSLALPLELKKWGSFEHNRIRCIRD